MTIKDGRQWMSTNVSQKLGAISKFKKATDQAGKTNKLSNKQAHTKNNNAS